LGQPDAGGLRGFGNVGWQRWLPKPLSGELLRQRLVRRRKNARRPTIRWSLAPPRRLIPSSGNRRREAQLSVRF